MGIISLNEKECMACGLCVEVCVRSNFYYDDLQKVRVIENAREYCIDCGHCVAICPSEMALTFEGYETEPVDILPIPDPQSIHNFLCSRRSIRRFGDAVPTREQLDSLIDIGRYAPSGHNSQDFHFAVIAGKEQVRIIGESVLKFYKKILKRIDTFTGGMAIRVIAGKSSYNVLKEMAPRLKQHISHYEETGSIHMVWDAPCLILIHGPEGNVSQMNSTLAGYNIILKAHSMGLGTCILGLLQGGINYAKEGLDSVGVTIPGNHKIHMILCVGIPHTSLRFKKIPPRNPPNVQYVGDFS
jgi:nitroreductase/NAD-dependent dihydropyrimidine dehydrogenase PreA subunit